MTRVDLLDWTGWSAARIDGFGATWRDVATRNLVLRGRGSATKAPPRRSGLTAKFAWHGRELYRVDGRTLVADDSGWIVIGAGELYESEIARGGPVETVAAFFDAQLVEAIRAERRATEWGLLDGAPAATVHEPLPIGRRRLAYDRELAAAAAAVTVDLQGLALAELLHVTLARILHATGDARRERERLPSVRAATRAELHRRLSRAHDLLMTAYAEPLDLARLAAEAAMAPHHFLHRFRDAFRITPHRLLVRRRIERACELLARTDDPIAEIARAVGFESAAAFSARFRRETGTSPRLYRQQYAISEHSWIVGRR